jgi:hypothetical protein
MRGFSPPPTTTHCQDGSTNRNGLETTRQPPATLDRLFILENRVFQEWAVDLALS